MSRPAGRRRDWAHQQRRLKSGGTPWTLIIGVALLLAFVGVVAAGTVPKYLARQESERFAPDPSNPDPSVNIAGVERVEYPAGNHILANQRVAYDRSPPFGGAHDSVWATCTGTVYSQAIRTENAVHSMEHGAVWLTYNPDRVTASQIGELARTAQGRGFMLMSPYPGLDSAIAVQSWGHQLKLSDPSDERLPRFVAALSQNPNTYPEAGATCSTLSFDTANPPPFDPTPPGPDAIPAVGAAEGGAVAPPRG